MCFLGNMIQAARIQFRGFRGPAGLVGLGARARGSFFLIFEVRVTAVSYTRSLLEPIPSSTI